MTLDLYLEKNLVPKRIPSYHRLDKKICRLVQVETEEDGHVHMPHLDFPDWVHRNYVVLPPPENWAEELRDSYYRRRKEGARVGRRKTYNPHLFTWILAEEFWREEEKDRQDNPLTTWTRTLGCWVSEGWIPLPQTLLWPGTPLSLEERQALEIEDKIEYGLP